MSYLKKGWAIVGNPTNGSIDKLYDYLSQKGIKPKEFMLYGDIRTFIRANELPEDEAIAFHQGHFVGTLEDVNEYIAEYLHETDFS